MDDSTATINEAIQLVEDRLASRVSIVFSHDFLQEFPLSAQAYFNEGICMIFIIIIMKCVFDQFRNNIR